MKILFDLSEIDESCRVLVGGKAWALARMVAHGLPVPRALCVSTEGYHRFLDATGLRCSILMEVHRKQFEQMRWEEMWDASLRIRNLFLRSAVPPALAGLVQEKVGRRFGDRPVVVRSSAVGEDSAKASFAGLHESYVNVRGAEAILEHIKLVWASLWSDAAMLYRKEIGLDVEHSGMAVVVQELVCGQKSGIVFGRSPNDETRAMVEAVYGLNQGLVDGTIEPDRWTLDRASGRIVSFTPAARDKAVTPDDKATKIISLSAARRRRPPLENDEVIEVFRLEKRLEQVFSCAQDVEWTYRDGDLHVLQSRPITTGTASATDDTRRWYLSLSRSLDNLNTLRQRIETELIPGMLSDADALAGIDLEELTNRALAREIEHRRAVYEKWKQVYWDDFIPFAHGFRLFGQVYNQRLKPEDPYEFIDLLTSGALISVQRNRRLQALADLVRSSRRLTAALRAGRAPAHRAFETALNAFLTDFESPLLGASSDPQARDRICRFLLQMAASAKPTEVKRRRNRDAMAARFLDSFEPDRRDVAAGLLDLGRISYKLRDDDNIFLGRLEAQVDRALAEAARRSQKIARVDPALDGVDEIARALAHPESAPKPAHAKGPLRPRQLIGQPAGRGVATGIAAVVTAPDDLFSFRRGDILVCDAIDPNMTFVVPLAAAVVERRGGMLIHGAIIAREYGLPCVTGIPDATAWIRTGDRLTVDGYLGIVTVERKEPS